MQVQLQANVILNNITTVTELEIFTEKRKKIFERDNLDLTLLPKVIVEHFHVSFKKICFFHI